MLSFSFLLFVELFEFSIYEVFVFIPSDSLLTYVFSCFMLTFISFLLTSSFVGIYILTPSSIIYAKLISLIFAFSNNPPAASIASDILLFSFISYIPSFFTAPVIYITILFSSLSVVALSCFFFFFFFIFFYSVLFSIISFVFENALYVTITDIIIIVIIIIIFLFILCIYFPPFY